MSNYFVLDTNIISETLRNLKPQSVFKNIWGALEEGIESGHIISVDEVYRELGNWEQAKNSEMWEWLKANKKAFQATTNEEGQIVAEIYKHPKFREGIKEKSMRTGTPEADAFLVAKTKNTNGILVTQEKYRNHSAKIPNICEEFDVLYVDRDNFYKILDNIYNNRDALKDITFGSFEDDTDKSGA